MLEMSDFVMNTNVEQKIFAEPPRSVYDSTVKKLHSLEALLSFYRETSDVSLLNRNAGIKPVKISRELMSILCCSQRIAAVSGNAFNIMLAPIIQLWKTAGRNGKLPSCAEIASTLALCKAENLVLNETAGTAFLTKAGSMVDLGGIAKGFAADVCCEIYREIGVTSAFVNLGGNVKTVGSRPDGKLWIVGLQHPDKPRGECYGAVMCSDLSIVTSGAYERYLEIGGEKYHHIIDGNTGEPSQSDLKGVTVISDNSMQADALSTAAFVLGLEKGVELIYASECVGAVFFTDTDKVYLTKGIKQNVRLFEKLSCYEI